MSDKEISCPISIKDAILIVRKDPGVELVLKTDPKTEIYVQAVDEKANLYLQKEIPDLLTKESICAYSINVVSSKVFSNQGYKKIRFYLSPEGQILRRLETT